MLVCVMNFFMNIVYIDFFRSVDVLTYKYVTDYELLEYRGIANW